MMKTYRVCTLCDQMYPSGGYHAHALAHVPVRGRVVNRVCTLCDGMYPSGGYHAHALAHTPVRKGSQGPKPDRLDFAALVAWAGSISAAARALGVSRQYVHQELNRDPAGRAYKAIRRTLDVAR